MLRLRRAVLRRERLARHGLGWWHQVDLLAVFACLNIIQFIIGSYIEPRVSGSALAISPFIVLFSVFFWTYLWGLFGAFIGVPITIALLTFCAQHPSSRWLAVVLGRRTAVPAIKGPH